MPAQILHVDPRHPQPRRIDQAVRLLEEGGLVVYPTDTAYAVGCDLSSRRGIDRLYGLKRRDPKRPMTFLVPDLSQAARYAQVPDTVYRTMKRLTPGPYTFILHATKEVPKVVATKQKTVGVRIPDDAVVLALLEGLGRPILTSTVTRNGGEIIADPREIKDVHGNLVDLILDVGLNLFDKSTVVDLTSGEPEVLREGKGPVEDL